MVAHPDELLSRLRRDPRDASAYNALKTHYQQQGDEAALLGLVEHWASAQPDPAQAAEGFREAAELAVERTGELERGAQLSYSAGEQWERLQRVDRAVEAYRYAFEVDPSMVAAIYAAREIYRNAGDLDSAAILYEREAEAEQDPARRVSLLRELAYLRSESLGDLDGAVDALERALPMAPEDLGIMHELATTLLGRAEGAADAAAADADRRRAADLLYHMAAYVPVDHAIAYCESALEATPDHEAAMQMLERLADEHDRTDVLPARWVTFLQAAPHADGNMERRRQLGFAYRNAGQLDDAIICFEPLMQQGDADAAKALADLYQRTGREQEVPKALEVATARASPEERSAQLRSWVSSMAEQQRHEEALPQARELLQLDPADDDALAVLEHVCREHGAFRELRDAWVAAAHAPHVADDARVERLREAAQLSEGELDDPEGAIEAWRAILEADAEDMDAHDALVRLFEQRRRWDELAELLRQRAPVLADPDARAEVYRKLAEVQRDRRGDHAGAVDALRKLYELEPDNDQVRDALCDELLGTGAMAEAVPLLDERVSTTSERSERIRLRHILAEALEEHAGDDESAFQTCASLLEDDPADTDALDRMERIDSRSGNWTRLLETLDHRADVVSSDQERSEIFRCMGEVADTSLHDLDRAAEHYGRALDLEPREPRTLDALVDVYDRAGRHDDLVALLRERASTEDDAETRLELQRRIARTLAHQLHNRDAAADAWRKVLDIREDPEALRFLREHASAQQDAEEHADVTRRLAELTDDPAEKRDLLLERASLLADRLERPTDARDVLRELVRHVAPRDLEVLQRLVELCERTEDTRGLSGALERQLAATEDDAERARIARRLADLYEELQAPAYAVDALYVWADAEPVEPEPRRKLVPLLEAAERYPELVEVLDALSGVEPSEDAAGEAVRKAARLAAEQLGDLDGAWRRLVPQVEQDDEDADQLLHEMAIAHGKPEPLADLYIRLAQQADTSAGQGRRWMDAARLYETDVGDASRALEAVLRALALDLGDTDIRAEVDRLACAAGAWQRLSQVYDTLLRKTEDTAERVRLCLRHATLLDEEAARPSEALDRVLLACTLTPLDDEVVERAETLARRTERGETILPIYDRRRARATDHEARLETLTRAARWCDTVLDDRDRALRYVGEAVAIVAQDRASLDPVEDLVTELDEGRADVEEGAGTRALISMYERVANDAARDAELAAFLLVRAARRVAGSLNDQARAYELLKEAAVRSPGSPWVLDELEQLARAAGWLDALQTQLGELADEALESTTAASLLRRRARVLEAELGRYGEAAEVYRQLVTLAPTDAEVPGRLRSCLRRAGRYQDLLIAVDRELDRTSDRRHRVALLKEMAATWEVELQNRHEALDSWKKVQSTDPDDEVAEAALQRLARSTRLVDDEDDDEDEEISEGERRPSAQPPPDPRELSPLRANELEQAPAAPASGAAYPPPGTLEMPSVPRRAEDAAPAPHPAPETASSDAAEADALEPDEMEAADLDSLLEGSDTEDAPAAASAGGPGAQPTQEADNAFARRRQARPADDADEELEDLPSEEIQIVSDGEPPASTPPPPPPSERPPSSSKPPPPPSQPPASASKPPPPPPSHPPATNSKPPPVPPSSSDED